MVSDTTAAMESELPAPEHEHGDPVDGPDDERALKRRQCNMDKRALLGEDAFKKAKAAARKAQRAAKKKTRAAAAAAAPAAAAAAAPDAAGVESAAPACDIAGQLERVAGLKEKGMLTDDEFTAAKAAILAVSPPAPLQAMPLHPPPPVAATAATTTTAAFAANAANAATATEAAEQQVPEAAAAIAAAPGAPEAPEAAQQERPAPSQPPQLSQPPPPPPEQRWEYVDGMYRCVVASAINFIKVWQASSEQQTVLELPPAIDAVERARVAAFAESLGLAHETVDTFDGVMLRIAPAAAAAEAAPPEAAPPAAEAAAQAHTQATAQARTQTAAPTRPPPPLSELTEGQSERMAASQAAAVARRAAAIASAAAETTEAAAVVATEYVSENSHSKLLRGTAHGENCPEVCPGVSLHVFMQKSY